MSTNAGCLPDCEGLTHNIECPNVAGQAAALRAKWSAARLTRGLVNGKLVHLVITPENDAALAAEFDGVPEEDYRDE